MTSLQIQDAHQCSGTRINIFPSPIQLGRLRPALLHFSPKWCKRNPCWILGYWEWQKSNGSRTHTQQKGFATALWLKRGPFFLRHVPCNHQARDFAVLKVTQIATSFTFPGFFFFFALVEMLESRGDCFQAWLLHGCWRNPWLQGRSTTVP